MKYRPSVFENIPNSVSYSVGEHLATVKILYIKVRNYKGFLRFEINFSFGSYRATCPATVASKMSLYKHGVTYWMSQAIGNFCIKLKSII